MFKISFVFKEIIQGHIRWVLGFDTNVIIQFGFDSQACNSFWFRSDYWLFWISGTVHGKFSQGGKKDLSPNAVKYTCASVGTIEG